VPSGAAVGAAGRRGGAGGLGGGLEVEVVSASVSGIMSATSFDSLELTDNTRKVGRGGAEWSEAGGGYAGALR
jgi:hypothetical protein